MADKTHTLQEWSNSLQKNFDELRISSEVVLSADQKNKVKNMQYADTLVAVSSRETGRSTQLALKRVAEQMKNVETHRDKTIAQIDRFLVGRTNAYLTRIKLQKSNVANRNAIQEKVTSKQKNLTKFSTSRKRDEAKILQARSALTEEQTRLTTSDENLDQSIIDFERDKLTDLRDMLMRYIESQLYIHTRAIEELTIAYDAAAKIDVQSDLRDIVSHLRINVGSNDDTDRDPRDRGRERENSGSLLGAGPLRDRDRDLRDRERGLPLPLRDDTYQDRDIDDYPIG